MNISVCLIIIILILLQGISLYQLHCYNSKFKQKDLKLIQYYLDIKFLHSILSDNLMINNGKDFCMNMIIFGKAYFNLDEIIIIDSIKALTPLEDDDNILKNNVEKYIATHKFDNTLSENELLKINTILANRDVNLYLSPLISDESSDGVIVCVETLPTLLSEVEVATLVSFVNLLKMRILI